MSYKLNHLLTGIIVLFAFVQCKDAVMFDPETDPTNLSEPQMVAPDDNSEQPTDVTLRWQAVDGADRYRIRVSSNQDFSNTLVDETTDSTAIQTESLPADKTIHWQVRAINGSDKSNWAESKSFTTESSSINATGTAGSVEEDRQALMDLYNATNGDSWNNNSGWGNGNPSDSWYGIETNAEGRVTRVDLYNNGLNGQLPASLGNLTKATYLNVKNNELTGEIPSSIGNMVSLEWLILSGRTYEIGGSTKQPPAPEDMFTYLYHPGKYDSSTNNFSGTIPSSIGNLSNLLFLELSGSSVTNLPAEIGNLTNLLGLYMSYNDFGGASIPSSFGNLTNLRHIIFNKSGLGGTLPSTLKNLTNLHVFHFASNDLTGGFPDLSNLNNLVQVVLSKNNLDGEYPSYWNNGNFTELRTLNLSFNNMTGTLHGFDNLPVMQSFIVNANNLSGTVESQLSEMPEKIQIIGLGWNNFRGEIPRSGWPDFSQLKTLYFNNNNLTGAISCDFWENVDNPRLGIAKLGNNEFSSNCTSSMNDVNGGADISVGDF